MLGPPAHKASVGDVFPQVGERSDPSETGGEPEFCSPTARERAERIAAESGADWEASREWREREKQRSAPDVSAAATAPQPSAAARFEAMAARAQAAQAESTGIGAAAQPPQHPPAARDVVAPAAAPMPGSPRLSREQWLKRELEAERLQRRTAQRTKARIEKLREDVHVFGAQREESLLRARAAIRKRTIEARPAKVREYLHELQADARTAYLVVGIKRLCDERGWSPIELCSRRFLCLLLFLRELAIPHCWNSKHVRPQARRGSKRLAKPEAIGGMLGTVRKYTPCARAVDQRKVLTAVLAADGHSPEDDRSCNVKTVQRALRALESVQLVQSVQVPPSAAEPWELGESGYAFNRYYVATPGSPKPALMGWWSSNSTDGAEVLARPWAGMRPISEPAPPPEA